MNAARLRHIMVLFVTLLCAAGMLLACASHKSVPPGEVNEVQIKTTDPLKAFEEEYEVIGEKVNEGSLSEEVMSRATAIRTGLQKYLIRVEAELEILRLDVLHGGDDERERALNQIVQLVEKREQTKISYLQELRAVSKPSEDKTGIKETGKDLDIEIKIAPENIGDGERP
jgi:hypothetical protein